MKRHAFRTIAIVALVGIGEIPIRFVRWCREFVEGCVWED